MQLSSVVCLWVFLPIVLSSASEMHPHSGSLTSKTPGLLLQCVLGHCPPVL